MDESKSVEIENLALRIQAGESALMYDLWNEVERFVSWLANRYAVFYVASGFASNEGEAYEDIFNGCGYPALNAAVSNYKADCGSFLTLLKFSLRREIRAFYGILSTKRDAILYADSLNAVIDDNMTERLALLEEPDDVIQKAEDEINRQELRHLLDAAIGELKEHESKVICDRYFGGKTFSEIASQLGVSKNYVSMVEKKAFRTIKRGSYGQKLYEHLYPGCEFDFGLRGTSFKVYQDTQERATERTALRIIEMKEKERKQKVDQVILDVLAVRAKYENK